MDVLITGSGIEIDSALKDYIRRRIDFALSRLNTNYWRSAICQHSQENTPQRWPLVSSLAFEYTCFIENPMSFAKWLKPIQLQGFLAGKDLSMI